MASKSEAGGLYFTDTKPINKANFDTRKIDTTGLDIEDDETTFPEDTGEFQGEKWYAYYGEDIEPSRVSLCRY